MLLRQRLPSQRITNSLSLLMRPLLCWRVVFLLFVLSLLNLDAFAQEEQPVDSLVRLLSAKSMELIEKDGVDYRKVTGPARFLHNATYLLCDTALWDVSAQRIFATGNVRILQENTALDSDKLTYYVDRDLAEFRGTVVQLEDKDHNVLRTEHLDYNTRDSVAIFFEGGSMKDAGGQVIESVRGTYDSKTKVFTFNDNVNMFTDSIFVKTTSLIYDAGTNVAHFGYGTDAWQEDNMLSSNAGWYDRAHEVFLFDKNVHGMNDTQEGWADSLYYYRNTGDIELLGNAQIIDTTRDAAALAGRIYYADSLSEIVLTRKPMVIGLTRVDGQAEADSVFVGADTLIARTRMMFEIGEGLKQESKTRLDNLSADPVQTYRRKAAQEAEEAAKKAIEEDPNRPPVGKKSPAATASASAKTTKAAKADTSEVAGTLPDRTDRLSLQKDSLHIGKDSLSLQADSLSVRADSLSLQADSVLTVEDSVKVNFVTGKSRVRLYRHDMQIACDSLEYNDLDSLVRLYKSPVVWHEVTRQYSADSLYAVIKNRSLQKASLMSNAFIIVREDTLCYDQIRATEMLAYFDSTGALKRFDALGDASAVFYLQEDSVYATVNKSEAKMLCAEFKEGELDKVYYFESTKNDAYPVAQMTSDERVLKGFNWQPGRRPVGRYDISPYRSRLSERKMYAARPKTAFIYTDKFFPSYMGEVYAKIEAGKIAKAKASRAREEQRNVDAARQDSLQMVSDSLGLASGNTLKEQGDSLKAKSDSLSAGGSLVGADSLSSRTDSLTAVSQLSTKAAKRAARIAAREARWARLDSLDAAKQKVAEEKKLAKARKKKLEALLQQNEQDRKDSLRLERYKEKYLRKKEREDQKKDRSKPISDSEPLQTEALPLAPVTVLEPQEDL